MGKVVKLTDQEMEDFGYSTPFDPSKVRQLEAPSLGESASAAVQQGGLGIIGQIGSGARIIGDLFGANSLSQWGRDVNLNAKQASEELIPLGEGAAQRVFREAGVNTAASLPALVSGGLIPALTIMGTQSYLDGYAKAKDGGLSTGRSHLYAGIDAIFETAIEAWSLPVLFKTGVPVIKQSMEFLSKELMGEEITTIGQKMNELLQLRPQMTVKEYWGELKQAMIDTAVVTPPTALMQFGIGKGVQMARKASSGVNVRVQGDPEPSVVPSVASPGIGFPVNTVDQSPDTVGPPQQSGPGLGGTPYIQPPSSAEIIARAGLNTPAAAPAPQMNPVEQIRQAAQQALIPQGPQLLQLPAPSKLSDPTPVPDAEGMVTPALQPIPQTDPADPAPTVEIPLETASTINAAVVPAEGPQTGADVAVLTLQPESVGSVHNDYRDYSPDEIMQQEQKDLRLYQGTFVPGKGVVYVRWNNDFLDEYSGRAGAWEFTASSASGSTIDEIFSKESPGNITVEQDYAVAAKLLENMTKQPLTAEFVQKQHRLMSLRDAVSSDQPLTKTQLAVYGERLGAIRDKAAYVRTQLGFNTSEGLRYNAGFESSLSGPADMLASPTPMPVVLPNMTDVEVRDSLKVGDVLVDPTVLADPNLKANFEKMGKLLKAWGKRYGVNGAYVLTQSPKDDRNSHIRQVTGAQAHVYYIQISTHGSQIENWNSLAHEFGHSLIWDTVLRADSPAVLTLTEKWLDSLTHFAVETQGKGNHADQVNFSGTGYGVSALKMGFNPVKGVGRKATLQFHEFGANQVSQHLLDNNYFDRTPGLKALITEIRERLEKFFNEAGKKFIPNTSFKEYLDRLAGVKEGKTVAKAAPTLVTKPKSEPTKFTKKHFTQGRTAVSFIDAQRAMGDGDYVFSMHDQDSTPVLITSPEDLMKWTADQLLIVPAGAVSVKRPKKSKTEHTAAGATVKHSELKIPLPVHGSLADMLSSGPKLTALETPEEPVKKSSKEQTLERAQLIKKLKSAGLWDAETQEALDPDLKASTFEFEKAKDLLNAAGINPYSSEVDEPDAHEVDEPDTIEVRRGLMQMGPKVEGLTQTMREKLADSSLSIRNFGRMWRGTLTALQVRKLYGGKVPGVKTFVDQLQAMAAYANKIRRRGESALELMIKVGNDQRMRVFDLMIKESADEKYYNKPEDFDRAGLDAKGIALYTTLREDYKYALETMKSLAHATLIQDFGVTEVNGVITDLKGKPVSEQKANNFKEEQKKIDVAFAKMEAVPYYPHTRFGDYYAVAKTKEGLVAFTQAETIEEVRQYANAMREDGIETWYGEMPESMKPMMNMPYQVFEMMKSKLDLTPTQLAEFDDILKNLAPEQSFIRKFQKRKNIVGWESRPEFGPQVYADYFSKFANYAARRHHSSSLDASIKDTRDYKRDMHGEGEANMLMIDRLLNWMEETKEYAMRPDVSAANLRAAVTLWYLGAVPKSAVVNTFSVPLMTLPWLGKRYGDIKAMNALKQAYVDVGKMWFKKDSMTLDERELQNWFEEVGVADQSYASTMAGVREGGRLMDSFALSPKDWTDSAGRRHAVKSAAYNIKYWAMFPFHKVEVMNRLVSGLAAYRLAKAEMGYTGNSMNKEAAEIAKDCIQDTQNENQQWNRPELMRGKKSLLTLFMSYTQNAMYQMYGGDKSWQRMLALQLAMAGLMGLPLAKNLDDIIQWFAKEVFGTKASVDSAIRDYLAGTIINPDWVLKGASYNLLGTGVNLQSSLSMGNLIPGIDALVLEGTFPERLTNAASDVGGAGAAVVMSFMQAMADDSPDSLKAWSRAMPTQAKNLFEGYRMITKGTVTDAAGDPIMNVSGFEGTAKLLGFQPSSVTTEREKRFAQKQMVQYWMTRRKLVFDLHELAEQTGDTKIDLEADKALDEFNNEVPDDALAIKRSDLRTAMQRRAKNAGKKLEDEPIQRSARGVYEQVGNRYSTE